MVALLVSMSVASAGTEAARRLCPTRLPSQRPRCRTRPRSRQSTAASRLRSSATRWAAGTPVTWRSRPGSPRTRHQGQGGAASDCVGRLLLAARTGVHIARLLVRRGDDRRRLAWCVRPVPRRPEAEARRPGEAARGRDRRQRHGWRPPGRDAVVRRLRDPLLPHRSAEEVRLCSPPTTWAQLFAMAKKIQDGEKALKRGVLGHGLPGEQLRGAHVRRARVDRLLGRRPVHRRRQGHDQQPESRRDSRPVPPEHRRDDAARGDLVPGG